MVAGKQTLTSLSGDLSRPSANHCQALNIRLITQLVIPSVLSVSTQASSVSR